MVYLSSINNQNLQKVAFGKEENAQEQKKPAVLLYKEMKENPIKTTLQIEGDKLKNAFTTYPVKGLEGSKNANFYEFLTMGTVPYLVGSGMMMAVFNGASKFFDTPAAHSASKLGKKMALGVMFYGLAKTLSKKFVETPVNLKYGIDVNVPYRKKIDELPEERNKDNLISYEYHKAYESVDFPYWDLFYDNKDFGNERNSYFDNVGRKMGFSDEDLEHSDQKVKPLIREKLIQTKVFSTLSSYLWAAVGVGIAMQKPWENLALNPVNKVKNIKNNIVDGFNKGTFNGIKNTIKTAGKTVADAAAFSSDFLKKFAQSSKQLIGADSLNIKDIIAKCKGESLENIKKPLAKHIAGRALVASAVGMTLLGNFFTLTNFNKDKGNNPNASTTLIDDDKEKVVC